MTVSDGDFRRPPQLWEQKLAALVSTSNVGAIAGGATSEVPFEPAPGTGAPGEEAPAPAPAPARFGTPSTPTLTGGVQSIMVTWDGLNSSGDLYPYESAVVEIHMSTSTGFTPSSSTLKGSMRYPGSFTVTGLTAATTYYFKLRGLDAAGNYSTASAQASGTPGLTTSGDYGTATIGSGAVSFDARAIGGITTTVGTSTPTSPKTGDIWLDSTGGVTTHKRYNGSSWVTQAWGSDSLSANCITATQIAASAITAGAIAADAVTAAKIKSDAIDGKTIVGSTIKTSSTVGATTPKAGIILDTSGLRGYNSSGTETINVNASTGAVTLTGYLTATDVGSGGSTTIDGGRITTGSVSGDRITGGTIVGTTFTTTSGGSGRIVIADSASRDRIRFYYSGSLLTDMYAAAVSGTNYLYITSACWITGDIISGADISATGNLSGADLTANGTTYLTGALSPTSSSVPNVRINTTTGEIKYTTHANSAQRFKHEIIALSDATLENVDAELIGDPLAQAVDPVDVLTLTPVQYRRNEDPDAVVTGFIAEDVEAKFPTAATYGDDGVLESIDVRAITAGLLAVVQQQQATIADLTARVEALEAK